MNDDCVLCVLAKLGVCDLVNCLLVSKRFNTIIKNNLIWSILFKEKFYNFKFVEGNDFYENYKNYSVLTNFLLKYNKGINIRFIWHDLILWNNNITFVPKQISHLKTLERLYLSNNNLQSIPKEIGQLSELKILSLHHNKLQTIPQELGQLKMLHTLCLCYNQLQSIPQEIDQLTLLQNLSLDHNQLQTIPQEIIFLPNLECLYLDKNLKDHISPNNNIIIYL